jgi:Concanavalin A-like lectin/glucanases superfamily
MFELVLHHRYADVHPHDLSGHANHGYGDLRRVAGHDGQISAVAFDGAHDRIFVPPSATLARPGGIRADLVVSVEELGHRRTLIEGYLSFAVGVEGDGALGGSIYRYNHWNGVRSRAGLVPLGRWITVTFLYTTDGVMTLSMDGELVAEDYRALGSAHGIGWPFGLSIGAWPDADQRVLKGRLEEVKLWRSLPSRSA